MRHPLKSGAAIDQGQLLLPLLDALETCGGAAAPGDVYPVMAESLGVRDPERQIDGGKGGQVNAFARDVRWARQRAKLEGLIDSPSPGMWRLTGKGNKALREARPGVVVTVFTSESGVALWARCEDALRYVDDASVQLIFTSPPYALQRKKAYGNKDSRSYVDWMTDLVAAQREKLTADGSLVLNLGDCWEKGRPSLDLYAERLLIRLVDDLGLNLAQRFEWENPSKMPAPAEWVTIRRERVKPSLERLYWLSPADHPYADNRTVLKPYSASMSRRLASGGDTRGERPSGHVVGDGAFATDNGGAIPGNLLSIPNTDSGSAYLRYCREEGLPVHPARFPVALPRFFIKLLSRPGDVVADFMAGSGTLAAAAEPMGRKWIIGEMMLEYLQGLPGRLAGSTFGELR